MRFWAAPIAETCSSSAQGSNAGAEMQCPVMEVLRDGRAVAAELFLRHKDGHRTPVHVFAFPLRNSMGEMRGVGEIFDPSHGKQESAAWPGHSEREFEIATGLPAVEESREHLQALLHSRSASSSALIVDRDVRAARDPAARRNGDAAPGDSRAGQNRCGAAALTQLRWLLERLEADRNCSGVRARNDWNAEIETGRGGFILRGEVVG